MEDEVKIMMEGGPKDGTLCAIGNRYAEFVYCPWAEPMQPYSYFDTSPVYQEVKVAIYRQSTVRHNVYVFQGIS